MSAVSPLQTLGIRPLVAADLDRLTDIEDRAYRGLGWSRGIFQDCLGVGYDCWGAVSESRLVGYGILSVAAGESHLLNLAVDPDCQGRGIGSTLLEFLLVAAANQRAECMFLEVRTSNKVAQLLYKRAGFSEFGRRRGYYPAGHDGRREDALIFCRRLD